MPGDTAYDELIALLDRHEATYRVLEHQPEAVTEEAGRLAGYDFRQAAKCIVVLVKVDRRTTRYAAAVVPGHRRVDFARLKALYGGSYAGFAPADVAEDLAGTPVGTIPPFSFDERMDLLVDPDVLDHPEIFFNAARLDRSIGLRTEDYRSIARPRVEPITQA